MKIKISLIALVALAFTASAAAAAHKSTLRLSSPATLNGAALAAGEYHVEWSDAGSITVLQGRKVVASAQGKVVEQSTAARGNTYLTKAGQITEIQFQSSRNKIVLGEAEQAKSD